jgi:hypothetical protein
MSLSTRLTIPDVARRLGVPGLDVYQLIFSGQLEGGPASDGAVYVTDEAMADYERHLEQLSTTEQARHI